MGLNMIYAIIENETNLVINVVKLEEGANWTPPNNNYLVDITNLEVGINWTYNPQTSEWTAPPEPVIDSTTEEPVSPSEQIGVTRV